MDIGFFTSKTELEQHFEKKIKTGWCVIEGSIDDIQRFEEKIYTPGTPKNKDFEVVGFVPAYVFLAKKTQALREFLGNPPEFKNIVSILLLRGNSQNQNQNKLYASLTSVEETERGRKALKELCGRLADSVMQEGERWS